MGRQMTFLLQYRISGGNWHTMKTFYTESIARDYLTRQYAPFVEYRLIEGPQKCAK